MFKKYANSFKILPKVYKGPDIENKDYVYVQTTSEAIKLLVEKVGENLKARPTTTHTRPLS